jgi:hypothetical protein
MSRRRSLRELVEPPAQRPRIRDRDEVQETRMLNVINTASQSHPLYEPNLLDQIRSFFRRIPEFDTDSGKTCLFNQSPEYIKYCAEHLPVWINSLLNQKQLYISLPDSTEPPLPIRGWQVDVGQVGSLLPLSRQPLDIPYSKYSVRIRYRNDRITSELAGVNQRTLTRRKISNKDAQVKLTNLLRDTTQPLVQFRMTLDLPTNRAEWFEHSFKPVNLTTASGRKILPLTTYDIGVIHTRSGERKLGLFTVLGVHNGVLRSIGNSDIDFIFTQSMEWPV